MLFGSDLLDLVPVKTAGGIWFWSDVAVMGGWRIQRYASTETYRLLNSNNRLVACGTREECFSKFPADISSRTGRALVVLHGLGGWRSTMRRIETVAQAAGHDVIGIGYCSLIQGIAAHTATLESAFCFIADRGVREVSFAAYSMGGIVLREALSRRKCEWASRLSPHRAVFIATPNKGAAFAEYFASTPLIGLAGPCGSQLCPGLLADLPEPDCEFGVIAGGRGRSTGLNPMLDGDNDGIVGVEETKLDGMSDFLLIRSNHKSLVRRQDVAEQTVHFLERGRFRLEAHGSEFDS